MNAISADQVAQDEVSIRDLLADLARGKWIILVATVVCTVGAALAAWLLPNKYTADIVLSPVTQSGDNQLGGLGALASQFSGVASLAGISVTGDTKKFETLAVLQSQALTESYIQKNNLLPVLFSRKWDAARSDWKSADSAKRPTLWKANDYFKKRVRTVSLDPKTGLVTLSITWTDAKTAAKWANGLAALANEYLRQKAITESERNIAYLSEQAKRTDVLGVERALSDLLQSEINKVMLARGSEEYALKVIDPAAVPEKPSSPLPVLWTVAGFVGGLLLSALFVLARAYAGVNRQPYPA